MSHIEMSAAHAPTMGYALGLAGVTIFTAFNRRQREDSAKLRPDTRFAIRRSAVTGNEIATTLASFYAGI
jgi:hypothetical protein